MQNAATSTAASLVKNTPFASSDEEVLYLRDEVRRLQQQVAWFQKQVFSPKSEKRILDNPDQGNLLSLLSPLSEMLTEHVTPSILVPAHAARPRNNAHTTAPPTAACALVQTCLCK